MDDVIVYGGSMQEHDTRLKQVMGKMELAGLRLNKDKCKIRKSELHFLGQVVDENGVRADPEKVRAIAELKAPNNVHELKRVLGMINYMGIYIPSGNTGRSTIRTPTNRNCMDLGRGTGASFPATKGSAYDIASVVIL